MLNLLLNLDLIDFGLGSMNLLFSIFFFGARHARVVIAFLKVHYNLNLGIPTWRRMQQPFKLLAENPESQHLNPITCTILVLLAAHITFLCFW